ncbi:MAG: cytochrome P450 [Hyphomonas sp.]|nr:cytochrome P450 [Hyphomonas sp.]
MRIPKRGSFRIHPRFAWDRSGCSRLKSVADGVPPFSEHDRAGLPGPAEPARREILSLLDQAPEAWPPVWRWVSISRRNALGLFPAAAYSDMRLDFRSLRQSLCVVNDPQSAEEIFGAGAAKFGLTHLHKRMLKPSLGDGLIVAEGDSWKTQRRAAVRPAHPSSFLQNASLIDPLIQEFVAGLPGEGSPNEILTALCALSIDCIAATFFGYRGKIASPDVLDLISRHRRVVERVDWMDVLGLPPALESGRMKRARRVAHELDQRIFFEIQKMKQDREDADMAAGVNDRDFAVSILAGFESVAVTVNWALALLAQHPECISEIEAESFRRDEPAPVRAGKPERAMLTCVLLETLRLFPPLPLIYRVPKSDVGLPVGAIRKGTVVCVSPLLMHRHQAHWERPDSFEPQRWRADGASYPAFMPFGLGARQCVGMRMGMFLCQEILSRILQNTALQMVPNRIPLPRMGVSLRPQDPISFSFSPQRV